VVGSTLLRLPTTSYYFECLLLEFRRSGYTQQQTLAVAHRLSPSTAFYNVRKFTPQPPNQPPHHHLKADEEYDSRGRIKQNMCDSETWTRSQLMKGELCARRLLVELIESIY